MHDDDSVVVDIPRVEGMNVFLDYQEEWFRDRSDVKISVKSRRAGITWTTAAEASEVAQASDGSDFLYMCHRFQTAKEFIREAGEFALAAHELAAHDGYRVLDNPRDDIQVNQIKYASGKRILALPARASSLRGFGGVVCLDEAAQIPNFQEVFEAAAAHLIWGGRIIVISTHFGEGNAFNKLVQETIAKLNNYSLHTVSLVDAVRQGLYKRRCEVKGIEWSLAEEQAWLASMLRLPAASQEFLCIPAGNDAYFPRYLVERAMQPAAVIQLNLDDAFMYRPEAEKVTAIDDWLNGQVFPLFHDEFSGYDTWYSQDFGRAKRGDLSVWGITRLDKNLDRNCRIQVEMRNVPYDQQNYILERVCRRLIIMSRLRSITLDAGGNGATLAEHASITFGKSMVRSIQVNDHAYKKMLPQLKGALASHKMWIPADADTLADYGLVELDSGSPVIHRMKDGAGFRHGDSVVMHMLAYDASLEGGQTKAQTIAGFKKPGQYVW